MNINLSVFKRAAYKYKKIRYNCRYSFKKMSMYAPLINIPISYYKAYNKEQLRIYETGINGGGYFWSTAFSLPKYTIKCVSNTIKDSSMLNFKCINKEKATIHTLRNL